MITQEKMLAVFKKSLKTFKEDPHMERLNLFRHRTDKKKV